MELKKLNNIISILITITFIIFIVLIFSVTITQLKYVIKDYAERECYDLRGKLIFYECQEIPFATPCSELKTGFWCELPNGTEIDLNIKDVRN